ncbi:MAG: hypothetical protein OXC09_10260 [Truepera sp.]|nr:hypothetical protein [Truepera sp.]
MEARLDDIPRRLAGGVGSALEGLDYFAQDAIYRSMVAQDPSFIFDSLRPIGDEFWNLINGERTFAQIADALSFQFDFELDQELFLPLAAGLLREGRIELSPREAEGEA